MGMVSLFFFPLSFPFLLISLLCDFKTDWSLKTLVLASFQSKCRKAVVFFFRLVGHFLCANLPKEKEKNKHGICVLFAIHVNIK